MRYCVAHLCLVICLAALHKCTGKPSIIYVPAGYHAFQKIVCSERLKSNTYLNLSTYGEHQVSSGFSKFCVIENIGNITIASSSSSTNANVRCLSPNFGLGFLNITNLAILHINVSGCGGRLTSPAVKYDNDSSSFFYFPPDQYSVLFFSHISNLSVKAVFITHYRGYGMLITNCLKQSKIDYTIVQESNDTFAASSLHSSSGSGILVYFHNDASFDHTLRPESSSLSISHSQFKHGVNFLPFNSCLTYDFHSAQDFPLVSSAALSVIFAQTTFEVHVAISNCSSYGNHGQIGNGILLLFKGSYWMSSVTMTNIHSKKNCVMNSDCPGSFIRIVFDPTENSYSKSSTSNAVSVLDSQIDGDVCNTAVYITSTYDKSSKVEIKFTNFSCIGANSTQQGICLTAEQLYLSETQTGSLHIVLTSITARLNSLAGLEDYEATKPHLTDNHLYTGVFTFINLALVIIKGTRDMPVLFLNNSISAIMAYNTDIRLIGHITFIGNSAKDGAGFLLNGFSHLLLTENLTVAFVANRATVHGAAIAALTTGTEDDVCVFQLETTKENLGRIYELINISFTGNTGTYEIDVYPLYNCIQYLPLTNPTNLPTIYDQIFQGEYQLKSRGTQVCLCKTDGKTACQTQVGVNPNHANTFVAGHKIHVFTGSNFSITVITQDDGGNPAKTTVHFHLSDPSLAKLDFQGTILKYGNGCKQKSYSVKLKNVQLNEQQVRLELSAADMPTTLSLPIVILPCPLGFQQNSNGICECGFFFKKMNKFTHPTIECSIINNTAQIVVPPYSWIGTYSQENCTSSSSCPLAFGRMCLEHCQNESKAVTPEDIESDALCGFNRTGILCGKCKPSLSVMFGSPSCEHCTNWWLLSIVAYGILGVVLVVFLFMFRFTMDQGTVASLVFYGNIASITLTKLQHYQTNYFSYLIVFLSVINLDLGIPLCFYNGMNDVVKSGMQFVFPVYVWLIVGVIIFASHYSITISNFISNRAVQVLITLIHLSYMRIVLTVINIFSISKLHIENQTSIHVWLLSGSIGYGCSGHGILLGIAVLFTIGFITPYTAATLFAPFCWRYSFVNRFRPFFETLYHPYKEGYCYWFGIRMLVLVSMLLVSVVKSGRNLYTEVLTHELIFLLFTLVQTWKNPFRSNALGLLDLSYQANISVCYCIGVYYLLKDNFQSFRCVWALRSVIFLAFVTFCFTLIYHFCKFLLQVELPILDVIRATKHKVQLLLSFITGKNLQSSDHGLERGEDCSIREPLLESNSA